MQHRAEESEKLKKIAGGDVRRLERVQKSSAEEKRVELGRKWTWRMEREDKKLEWVDSEVLKIYDPAFPISRINFLP